MNELTFLVERIRKARVARSVSVLAAAECSLHPGAAARAEREEERSAESEHGSGERRAGEQEPGGQREVDRYTGRDGKDRRRAADATIRRSRLDAADHDVEVGLCRSNPVAEGRSVVGP